MQIRHFPEYGYIWDFIKFNFIVQITKKNNILLYKHTLWKNIMNRYVYIVHIGKEGNLLE